jgi:hypothetical protein
MAKCEKVDCKKLQELVLNEGAMDATLKEEHIDPNSEEGKKFKDYWRRLFAACCAYHVGSVRIPGVIPPSVETPTPGVPPSGLGLAAAGVTIAAEPLPEPPPPLHVLARLIPATLFVLFLVWLSERWRGWPPFSFKCELIEPVTVGGFVEFCVYKCGGYIVVTPPTMTGICDPDLTWP